MKRRSDTYPSAIEAIFLVVGLFLAEYLVEALLHDLHSVSGIDPRDIYGIVAVLGNGILFTVLLHFTGMSYASLFHDSKNSIPATVGTLAIPVLLLIPGLFLSVSAIEAVLTWAFPLSYSQKAMFERMMSNNVPSVVTVCLLAPILEEMLFRGIILRSFLNQYRRTHAIVGSAALFGMAHLNIYQFCAGTLLGLISGWLYERSRSLWPCIILHASYNSAVAFADLNFDTSTEIESWTRSPTFWGISFSLAFTGAFLLKRFLGGPRQAT